MSARQRAAAKRKARSMERKQQAEGMQKQLSESKVIQNKVTSQNHRGQKLVIEAAAIDTGSAEVRFD